MAELESEIEQKLIDQLCRTDSQWTYRDDLNNEDKLWENFKYILEQNNKDILGDTCLSEQEFAKIKNDVSHSSFYDAAEWLIGENGRVQVHVQRGNETLHLLVLNNEHIAGGTTTYEVINQYQAFKNEDGGDHSRSRRFDVTLLINGLPLIHIELKSRSHAYHEGFRQIKKYIREGKFTGLFSNVQMFVVSNVVDTKYFSAADESELKIDFLSGWVDEDNKPVGNYLDFAKSVLKIPEAHEIVTKYKVLDYEAKRLLLLRPYQIHAIQAMRRASKLGQSGYIWHTTGSGKTLTSYKATRNLLMDIPSIDKTIFLIDRKDLDQQTSTAFKSYAENDTIDVEDTNHTQSLIKKLSDNNRRMIVTTVQKLTIMINKKLEEGSSKYNKIKNLRLAFVVDECHRAVSPQMQRVIKKFFHNSLWFGFTGTPIFQENSYAIKGDLPQTTDELYGPCLHKYTIKEAIHDKAVLGFMIENLGVNPKSNTDFEIEGSLEHMRTVLDVILNKSQHKLGLNLGRGNTFEGLLTVSSIRIAQEYYKLLKKVKNGEDELKIDEDILKALPDFPKFAITYSLSENDEASQVNQDLMQEALDDYNAMFGTNDSIENIAAYNEKLNERLSRKKKKYAKRSEQLDLVIVVDRLLTGFDAPCLSTVFLDRPPMKPQHIIQAFSRTNRIYNEYKKFGQIVTCQMPLDFKDAIDEALTLYSCGGDTESVSESWEQVLKNFEKAISAIRKLIKMPEETLTLSDKEKKIFIKLFRDLDFNYSHLKAFSKFTPEVLKPYEFSEDEYIELAGYYRNLIEELKAPEAPENPDGDEGSGRGDGTDDPILDDYELIAFNKVTVDYEYIVKLIREFVRSLSNKEGESGGHSDSDLAEIRKVIGEYSVSNPKLAGILYEILDKALVDLSAFDDEDVSVSIHKMRNIAIDKEVEKFARKWGMDLDAVRYEVMHFRNGEIANENKLKEAADYDAYCAHTDSPLPKFKFRKALVDEFKNVLMPEVAEFID
ncbi:Type-1 restriction enzyme R protein [Anaerobiospirillum thomasii]|uniref:type I restriction endonuclease subunit R n=1 Tax=Anaerobiospirillum thomasii TaxID=179995 RepID=UPI000D8840B3|nr:type I restriction endonuclease subunit R [Anaerobiospirillum thomasii]SPT71817.1 Type-1 restriction enzyme R protein [Anaerobiospirillum thomasii]